jgi:hypothetical protein
MALIVTQLPTRTPSTFPTPTPYKCEENSMEFAEPEDLEEWQKERYLSEDFQYGLENPKPKCTGEIGRRMHTGLQEDLDILQQPADCTGRFLIWRLGTGGFGQEVRKLAYQLAIAFAENRTLLLDTSKPWKYTDKDICPEQSFYCYFEPLTQCTMQDLGKSYESFPVWSEDSINERVVVGNYNTDKWRYFTPEKYGTALSLEWFRAELLAYVMRTNEYTKLLVRDEKIKLGLDPDAHTLPYISMHIRGGDKKSEYKLHPWKSYLNKANWFKSLYGVDNIFLVSDDANVMEQAATEPNFHIVWASGERTPGGSHEITETGHSVMVKVLKDILIASSCKYWIGTLSSNFGDVIWELMVARNHGTIPPYISLDIPWTTHNQPNVFI